MVSERESNRTGDGIEIQRLTQSWKNQLIPKLLAVRTVITVLHLHRRDPFVAIEVLPRQSFERESRAPDFSRARRIVVDSPR